MKDNRGEQSVDALKDFSPEGNIIPMEWFAHLKFESGKPDMNAILILSDIVYWYRPTQVRDEETGRVIGYRKKFKSDLLQKSYHHYANLFGLSKRQVTDAIVRLEERGLIRRIFRNVETACVSLQNVLFIALDVEKVKQLQASVGGVTFYRETPHDRTGDPSRLIGTPPPTDLETYTEITTQTTTKIPTETLPLVGGDGPEEEEDDQGNHDLCQALMEIWNQTVQQHLPVKEISLNPKRAELMEALCQEVFGDRDPVDAWTQYCTSISQTRFLMGQGPKGFRVSLDWALNPANAVKILEGAFYDKPESPQVLSDKSDGQDKPWAEFSEEITAKALPGSHISQWLCVSQHLIKRLGQLTYKSWFLGVSLVEAKGTKACLEVDTAFKRDYLLTHFLDDLREAFQRVYPCVTTLEIAVRGASHV